MSSTVRAVILSATGALAAVGVLHLLGWVHPGGRDPLYRNVVADSAAVVQGEPDPEVGLVESVVRPRTQPTVRATAPAAAAGDVQAFCLAAGYAPAPASSAPGPAKPGLAGGDLPRDSPLIPEPEQVVGPLVQARDSTPAATLPASPSGLPPALRLRPVAFIRSGTVSRRGAEFWLPLSSGDLVRATYSGLRPPYSFRVDGDSLIVQRRRAPWLEDLIPVGLCALGAWGSLQLDSPLPAAAGCGLGITLVVR